MFVCCEANSNVADSRASFCDSPQNASGLRVVSRNDFLFTAAVIAVIAGFFFPPSAHLLDVFLIFSVCLTAAALVITFSAKQALQVQGFPLLVVLTTTLRIALSVASTKLILSQGNAGVTINLLGDIIVRNNPAIPWPAISFFAMLVVVILAVILKTANGIRRTASHFTTDIVPIKQVRINSDFNCGVIDSERADSLREKMAREVSFFIAMAGAAGFILCAAVIELVVAFVNIAASMTIGVIGETATEVSVKTYATLTVGAGVVTQISALLAAVASGYLVRKSLVHSIANGEPAEYKHTGAKRIKVVSNEVTQPETQQSQDEDTISYVESTEHFNSGKAITEEVEWFDEETSGGNEKENLNLWNWQEVKDSDSCQAVAELIESQMEQGRVEAKTILIAAESVEELGVTVPVNVAIRLAQTGRKCLLIDLDRKRDAISKVFDIDSDKIQAKAIATCVSNLWVWSASNCSKSCTPNLNAVIAGRQRQYDCLVVYAPNTKILADSDNLAGCVQIAMLFGSGDKLKGSAITDLHKLLTNKGCEILEPKHILVEAV